MEHKEHKKAKSNSMSLITKGRTDITLVFVVLLLMVFGIVMIYSSSYYSAYAHYGNHNHFFIRQVIWVVIGAVVMFIVSRINYRLFLKFSGYFYVIMLIMLILVLLQPEDINGSKRWLTLFGDMSIQPSELAKVVLIMAMSSLMAGFEKHINNIKALGFVLGATALPILLIGVENLSTAIVITAIIGGMVFVMYKNVPKLILIALPPLVLLGFIFFQVAGYRSSRIDIWLNGPFSDPLGKGFQTIQSLYAIGSGGFFGVGLGKSIQKIDFIPEAHNDIIFSIICEELGLFGAIAIIMLFALLLWRCLEIIRSSSAVVEILIVTAVMIHIGLQVFINIGVVTNTIPATGIPLPFISYGGSSLIFLLVELGLVLNIARQNASRLDHL
ncbi:MAG: FtsW/RodA/SpoVE family cell cycle protein [Vallitaleaceae bacterium]|nr:FtsW/RodA/SpoVE family cell cycle protein [Vallitaleaceae bacterium]